MTLLPTKFLLPKRSLTFIGGEILALLAQGALTPSATSDRLNAGRDIPVDFDTVALALAFLYAIGAVVEDGGAIRLANQHGKENLNASRE
ncbi:hypothetical protein HFN89_07100 [Rhizobium laguerreae]|nr:hypothetical protein [Rhizobium laguerreae]